MFCPQCEAEYRTGFTHCADCNVPLVERLSSAVPESLRNHPELVTVHTFTNWVDAEIAKTALQAADIESMLESDDSGKTSPSMAITQGVHMLVRSEDCAAANEILSIEATEAQETE